MQFSRELRAGVLSGDITLTVRLWQSPKVRAGGRYSVEDGQIEVDAVELVPFGSIDDADLIRTGEPDRATLRDRTAHAGPVHDETPVYRIEFHIVP